MFCYIIAILMFFVGLLVTAYMSRHTRVNRPHNRKIASTKTLINNACMHVSKYTGERMCVLPLMQYVFLDTLRTPNWPPASCSTKPSVSNEISGTFPFSFQITGSTLPRIERVNFALYVFLCYCINYKYTFLTII